MRVRVILCVVGLLGCRDPGLVEAGGALRLEPASLDFPVTLVGSTSSLRVELTNTSRAPRGVSLEVAAPFSAPPDVEVPGGESLGLELLFLPTTAGPASQTARLRSGTQTLTLELTGTATAPVSCPPAPAPCRAMQPTPEGTCVEVNVADDAPCSTPCVANGVCREGQCVGQPRDCGDGNACTTDACDEKTGCVRLPVTCATPANPCQAARCDAATGCSTVEVLDGTACGPNTCVTAKVCVAGQCREVSSPEGSSCAPSTPCQGAGACQQGRCVRPPPTPLAAAWTYQTPTGSTLTFPGVGDRAGNVYWLEVSGSTTWLVSVAFDGSPRFRVRAAGVPNPGASWPYATSPLMLVSDTQLVLLLRDQATNTAGHRIEARSAVDGSLQWSRSRADFVVPLGLAEGLPLWMMSATITGTPPRVALNLRTNAGGSAWTSWIVALETSTGTFAWKVESSYLNATIADETSVYTYEDLFRHTLIAISQHGAVRWSLDVTGSAATPTSAWDGKIYTVYPSSIRDAQTGAATATPMNASFTPRQTLVAFGRIVSMDSNSLCGRWLTVIDPSMPMAAPVVWQSGHLPGGGNACLGEPLLTSRQSVLLATRDVPTLFEVGLDGATQSACPLPLSPWGPAVLARGRWVASDANGRIEAFDVPAQDVAARGWVTAGGGLDRANRPTR